MDYVEKLPGWLGDRRQEQGQELGQSLYWGFQMKGKTEQDLGLASL